MQQQEPSDSPAGGLRPSVSGLEGHNSSSKIDPLSAPAVEKALSNGDAAGRRQTLQQLKQLKAMQLTEHASAILQRLEDPDAEVRALAQQLLGRQVAASNKADREHALDKALNVQHDAMRSDTMKAAALLERRPRLKQIHDTRVVALRQRQPIDAQQPQTQADLGNRGEWESAVATTIGVFATTLPSTALDAANGAPMHVEACLICMKQARTRDYPCGQSETGVLEQELPPHSAQGLLHCVLIALASNHVQPLHLQ